MKYLSVITDSEPVKQALRACGKGAVSHAYAIVSEDEFTAGVVSALLIAAISGADADRVYEGGYADVRVFPEQRDKILSADIDELTSTAYITSTELDKKFYIIRKASTMNESCQNKLLKTLEEAPPSVIIILEIQSEALILPTVISRCSRIDTAPADDVVLKRELGNYFAEGDVELAVALSGGYPGKAEKILGDAACGEDFALALETLMFMKTSRNILTYSRKWADRKERLDGIIDCTALILADCMSASEGLFRRLRLKSRLSDIKSLASEYPSEAAAGIMPFLTEAKKSLASYCNAQAVIDGLLFKILEVKAKCRKS